MYRAAAMNPGIEHKERTKGAEELGGPFEEEIMAVVTTDKDYVGGDVPIFFARDEAEKEQVALTLSRILRAMVHELATGVYVIVRH